MAKFKFVSLMRELADRAYRSIHIPLFVLALQTVVNHWFFEVMKEECTGEFFLSFVGNVYTALIVWAVWAIPLPRILSAIVRWVVVIVAVAVYLLESYTIYSYKTVYTDSVALAILGTNAAELREFFTTVAVWSAWSRSLGFLVGSGALFCLLGHLLRTPPPCGCKTRRIGSVNSFIRRCYWAG